MALRAVTVAVNALSTFFDRFQVELHGRYSVRMLEGFLNYSKSTSSLRVAAVLMLTAVPCTLVIILTDSLPLQPPSAGLAGQTATYWIRTCFSVFIITGTTFVQWSHASQSLSVWPIRFVVASILVSVATTLILLMLHTTVGFPTPFLYQAGSAPWQMLVALALCIMWRSIVRSDPELQQDLKGYFYLWAAEVTMIVVYPLFTFVFSSLEGQYQTLFSVALPLWKIVLRNWCSYGAFRREELAPVMVVFNVDVFQALFLASVMQLSSKSGSSTLVVVMAVDCIQAGIAVYEVARVRRHIKAVGVQIEALEGNKESISMNGNSLERAASILNLCQETREHPTIMEPRHRQLSTVRSETQRSLCQRRHSTVKVHALTDTFTRVHVSPSLQTPLQQLEELKREYVRANLKVLYMVEFYMLIEFTEVVVTIVYAVYLLAMSQLPNRKFYLPLKHLTGDQFTETVQYVMEYAALEMLSFLLLAAILTSMLRISTMRQLAFVLERHWLLVQTFLVLWVFFPTQMSLEHLGCDYTFKFAWLNKST